MVTAGPGRGLLDGYARTQAKARRRPRLRGTWPRSGARLCQRMACCSLLRATGQQSRRAAPPIAAGGGRRTCSLRCGEPAPGEPSTLEAATQVRILLHHAPDQCAALVLDHRANGPLIDAQVVDIDPSEARDAAAMAERDVEMEVRVECIDKAIFRIDVLAKAAIHFQHRRDRQFGSEGNRCHRRRKRKGTIVLVVRAARRVPTVYPLPAVVLKLDIRRTVACRDTPNRRPVALAAPRIGDRISLLGIDRPAAVLEVVEPALAHVVVLDFAKSIHTC